jgi:hypothetical protein
VLETKELERLYEYVCNGADEQSVLTRRLLASHLELMLERESEMNALGMVLLDAALLDQVRDRVATTPRSVVH